MLQIPPRLPTLDLFHAGSLLTIPPPSYEEATSQHEIRDFWSVAAQGPVQWPNYRPEMHHHPHLIPAGYESDSDEDNCHTQ